MPIASLELASPVVLASSPCGLQHRRPTTTGSVVVFAMIALFVGVGSGGLWAAVLSAIALVVVFVVARRSRWVQRSRELYVLERARVRREYSRQDAPYRTTAARRQQYQALCQLVEEIERTDPLEARRLELQDLLDYFLRLAVGHHRCLDVLEAAGGVVQVSTPITDKPLTQARRDIAARRFRQREETSARLARVADEIDATDDLIHLLAQRTACANLDTSFDGDGEIGRRLAELDEVDAAFVQVSA